MSSCVAPRPPMCLSKVVGSILPANDVARNGDLWCTKCEAKVDIHHKDTAKAAVVSGFPQILHQAVDFRITLNSFNMKQNIPTSFTVPRIKLPYPACAFWIRRRFFFQM
ncbi:hypothetical protein C5167_034183 [Papaver somniferum]|uniref:Uncharacterized protein n=1 Tax=Papaver somniferum TaxID=3469 RepID=A0A4Y7KF92_PAPSO|nr:hypothetical protein C5167_034183 [Papaver somniferum]